MPGLKPKASAGARRNANRARCQFAECDKFAQTRGLCKAHGGGSRCRDPDCNKLAQSRGLCIAHGGGRRCQFDGCAKLAQSKGYCISHGGGRRCTFVGCEKFSQVKGRCKSHSKLLAAASSPSSSAPNSPLASPTACAMTPPPCGLADAAMSPTKSKLSIGFLVNPSFAGVAEQPKRAPLPSFSSSLARYDQWRPQASANALPSHFSVFEPPRSLLSFLEPAQAERIRPTTVLPPLALYH
jgi:hypothetical protein